MRERPSGWSAPERPPSKEAHPGVCATLAVTASFRRGGHAMAIATRRQPRIPLEELCRLPSFYLPAVSWKGDGVAFYWDKTGQMELHVMDLATRETRQVSHGEVPRALR